MFRELFSICTLLVACGLAKETLSQNSSQRKPIVIAIAAGTLALAGNGAGAGERAVDVQINRLRRKIERDPASPLFLQAVRGIGYRLVASP